MWPGTSTTINTSKLVSVGPLHLCQEERRNVRYKIFLKDTIYSKCIFLKDTIFSKCKLSENSESTVEVR